MAFGKPAIGTPNQLELRGIATAISNARQRIEQLESTVTSNAAIASQSSNNALQFAALRSSLATLSARVATLEAAIGHDVLVLNASTAVAAYLAVVPTGNSTCAPADGNDPTAMFSVLGVSTNTAATGGAVSIQKSGPLTIPGGAFTPGRAVYVGDLGLTQTPNYESTAIVVGVAISGTEIWIAPGEPSLSEIVFSSAVGDEYLRYLPVTYQIVKQAVELISGLFEQPDGLVVFTGGGLVTRSLVSGGGIGITNPDGVDGNPEIALAALFVPPEGVLTLTGLAPAVTIT